MKTLRGLVTYASSVQGWDGFRAQGTVGARENTVARPCRGEFQVNDTLTVLIIWDYNFGNYSGPYM